MFNKKLKDTPKWFYFILILIPIALIIFTEFFLRLFNYGNDYKEWVSINNKYEILNPDIADKYFSGIKRLPYSTESFLLKEKPKDSFRIIALGASSGAGFPYQNSASFTKYLRKCLEYSYPDKKFEVANISMAAINSYTILDLLTGIIKKKPDLVIIYLGHNEYYGALGVGSNEGIAGSRSLKLFILNIKGYKIFQLLENTIKYLQSFWGKNESSSNGTLMASIAKEKLIELDSDTYFEGANQFEANLSDILSLLKDNNIPVFIGTLTSNLKDQEPFNSTESDKTKSAKAIYSKALNAYSMGNFAVSDSLFRLAKDLDGLRFRAPEKFNEVIYNLSIKYKFNVVNVDSAINSKSEHGIVGNELMVDHLHPNLEGYQIIGGAYFNAILKSDLLKYIKRELSFYTADSLVKQNFNFTKYDSLTAAFRIKILKNDWPFSEKKTIPDIEKLLKPNSFEEQVAFNVLTGKISRLDARLKLIDFYKKRNNSDTYVKELLALIEEFPTHKNILNEETQTLIENNQYSLAAKLLKASYNLEPDIFNTKWLGIMNMANNNYEDAVKYLSENLKFNVRDPQVYFNLAGAFFNQKKFDEAYQFVIECLKIKPNYKNANKFKEQLENILKK